MQRRRIWLVVNEREDAVRSLEWAAELADQVGPQPAHWKWLLLALQNALQGYMVVALEKGHGLLALKPHIVKKWLAAHEKGGPYPFEKLDDFPALYAKIKDPKHFGTPFSPTASQDRSIEKLNNLRADFSHFTPKGWRLELAGLPSIARECLALPEWVVSGDIALWHKASHVKRTRLAVRSLHRKLGGG